MTPAGTTAGGGGAQAKRLGKLSFKEEGNEMFESNTRTYGKMF